MNINFVTIGKGPDFVMTLGRMEIMHRTNVKIFYERSGRSEVHTISHRSFQQCLYELHRFIALRSDGARLSINSIDEVTGHSRVEVGLCNFDITPILPIQILHKHLKELVDIFNMNLKIFYKPPNMPTVIT